MKSWVLAVGLMAAAMSTPAQAADLGDYGPDQYGSTKDDPRYADMYRYPERRPYAEADPYGRVVPRAPIYGDRYDERDDYPDRRRYSYAEPRAPLRGHCVPREAIKHRLQAEGWFDFRDPEPRGELATVIARRPSGRQFELTIDRCSGEVVNVQRLDRRPYGPYAYGPEPRRWDRPY
jgi:hypothetical protein